MRSSSLSLAILAAATTVSTAFPFMADYGNMSDEQKRALTDTASKQLTRRAAVPYSSKYPYSGAKINGLPGSQKGGYLVPAKGDTDHQYQDPPSGAYRGPCPGLNAAANHGFLSRDGIVTFNELVAAQQNVYNVGYDLAVVLATAGVGLDGDLVTTRLSLGGDATSKTSSGIVSSAEGGLNTHNKFEADTSLTRNDYYTHNGDNFNFNGTLFGFMTKECNKVYNRDCLSRYRAARWKQSQAENPHFNFGPGSLLLYGAASFLYELMPTDGGGPDYETIKSFFGAVDNGDGTFSHVPERIPDNWFARTTPYTGVLVNAEILSMYLENPVPFGGNTGAGNFEGLNYGSQIVNGKFSPTAPRDISCLIQQALLSGVPSTVQGAITAPLANLVWMAAKLNPIFGQFGCPAVNPPSSQAAKKRFAKEA